MDIISIRFPLWLFLIVLSLLIFLTYYSLKYNFSMQSLVNYSLYIALYCAYFYYSEQGKILFYIIVKDETIDNFYFYTILNTMLIGIFMTATHRNKPSKVKAYFTLGIILYVILTGLEGLSYGFYISSDLIPLINYETFELCTREGLEFFKQNLTFLMSIYAVSFIFEGDE